MSISKASSPAELFQKSKTNALSGQNGKYWQVSDGGIACDSDTPHGFYLELREPTKVGVGIEQMNKPKNKELSLTTEPKIREIHPNDQA